MCIMKALAKRFTYKTASVSLGRTRVTAIVADTFLKKAVGLMYRPKLGRFECMLFLFGRSGFHGIWMANMNFPIDIVWLDEGFRVIDVVENAPPCKSAFGCPTYYPRSPASYVVEFTAGTAKKYGIKRSRKMKIKGLEMK